MIDAPKLIASAIVFFALAGIVIIGSFVFSWLMSREWGWLTIPICIVLFGIWLIYTTM